MIAVYKPCGTLRDAAGRMLDNFKAVGYCLPTSNRIVEYENSELEMLDLAYACTVHKSQGDEFKSVIINLQCAHSVMLVRPLIYTAITRAKERVIIVGERRALCIAIRRTDTEQRGTKLAMRIQEFMKFRREN